MLYVNRDSLGVPDLVEATREALGRPHPGLGAVEVTSQSVGDARVLQVSPSDASPSFSIRSYGTELISCDGLWEQCAAIGLLLAEGARPHGVRLAILTDGAEQAHPLDESMSLEELLTDGWRFIDPHLIGQGDLFGAPGS